MPDQPSDVLPPAPPQPRWQPLKAIDRRVLGVLAEKAKTTPDVYPMTINAICTGCNQKSNRAPVVNLEPGEVEESLDRLRGLGAVGLVEGYGRVQKYRHYLYEWLGVDKVELAVMTELLLRGDQTVGELRGRAARMEPIPDLAALRPLLDSLKSKGLVIALTSEGRGHVVTHALYEPRELEALRAKYRTGGMSSLDADEESPGAASAPAVASSAGPLSAAPLAGGASGTEALGAIRHDLAELRNQAAQMRSDLDELRDAHRRLSEELRGLKEALGG